MRSKKLQIIEKVLFAALVDSNLAPEESSAQINFVIRRRSDETEEWECIQVQDAEE